MIGQALDLFVDAIHALYRVHDAVMNFAPPLATESGVCDIMRERVLE